ncbi:unnamed protein product [Boreogadus saida]
MSGEREKAPGTQQTEHSNDHSHNRLLTAVVSRRSLAADGPPPRLQEAVISADRCRGGGKQGSSGIHSRPTIPFSSMSWFMYFRESKPKFLSPNSFSTMAEITPTKSLVVEIPEMRVRRVMRHHTNSRTVIQITRKCTTLALQSWGSTSE